MSLRLIQNTSAFESKRKDVSKQTLRRFNPDA